MEEFGFGQHEDAVRLLKELYQVTLYICALNMFVLENVAELASFSL